MHYQSEWMLHGTERSEAVRLSIPVAFHDTLLLSIILSVVVVFLSFPLHVEESKGTP